VPKLIAITREVSPAIVRCELTHMLRSPIDFGRAAAQHADYEHALGQLGCSIVRLPSDSDMPDSIFVEDAAVVLEEIAIMMRPGAASRRPEISAVADALRSYRPLGRIERSGTMDGGDVLLIGRSMFIGLSSRTNESGIEQIEKLVAPFGYVVRRVAVQGCLHLKSAVTALGDTALLINREWAPPDAFSEFELIDVDPDEPTAANVVRIDGRLLYSAAFPRTLERLERRGLPVTTVDVSEIAKAEGAVTCCSLIFKVNQ
jgi:dimethylargininase